MKITCYSCHKNMSTPGAIVFSPPFKNCRDLSVSTVHKYHVCAGCWETFMKCLEHLQDVKIVKERKE